jgi:hypothetical protein
VFVLALLSSIEWSPISLALNGATIFNPGQPMIEGTIIQLN